MQVPNTVFWLALEILRYSSLLTKFWETASVGQRWPSVYVALGSREGMCTVFAKRYDTRNLNQGFRPKNHEHQTSSKLLIE